MSQAFSFEFCEMFKNTNFIDHLWTITSVHLKNGIYSEVLSSFYLSVGISCWYALNSCSLSCNIRKFVLQLLVNIILISIKQIKIIMKKFSKVSRSPHFTEQLCGSFRVWFLRSMSRSNFNEGSFLLFKGGLLAHMT